MGYQIRSAGSCLSRQELRDKLRNSYSTPARNATRRKGSLILWRRRSIPDPSLVNLIIESPPLPPWSRIMLPEYWAAVGKTWRLVLRIPSAAEDLVRQSDVKDEVQTAFLCRCRAQRGVQQANTLPEMRIVAECSRSRGTFRRRPLDYGSGPISMVYPLFDRHQTVAPFRMG